MGNKIPMPWGDCGLVGYEYFLFTFRLPGLSLALCFWLVSGIDDDDGWVESQSPRCFSTVDLSREISMMT